MANYYVDYENVNFHGFDGIEELNTRDKIYIFCREHQIEDIRAKFFCIGGIKPTIKYISVEGNNPNALDFQLVTYMGLHIKHKDLSYIISKDHGFDPAIYMLREEGYFVFRRNTVSSDYEPLVLYRRLYDELAKKEKNGKRDQ